MQASVFSSSAALCSMTQMFKHFKLTPFWYENWPS